MTELHLRFQQPKSVLFGWVCRRIWAIGFFLGGVALSSAHGQVIGVVPDSVEGAIANSVAESSLIPGAVSTGTMAGASADLHNGPIGSAYSAYFEQQVPAITSQPSVELTQPAQRATGKQRLTRDQRKSARQQSRAEFTDPTPMRLGLQVDALNYAKTGSDDTPFVFGRTEIGGRIFPDFDSTLLRYSDLDSETESAARIRFLYQSDWGTGYEFSFFDFDNFVGATTINGGVPTFFGAIPADVVESYDISDASRLKSFELNAWERRSQRWRFGWGLRYVDFRNEFNTIESGSAVGSSTGTGFFSDADNDLFGAQVLTDLYFPVGNSLQIETGVRAGGYYNNIDIRFDSANRDVHYEGDNFSTVVDLNAGVRWATSNSFVLRAGYQWMLVGGIAAASSQSTDFGFYDTSAPIQFSNLTFQGGYFGAEVRF